MCRGCTSSCTPSRFALHEGVPHWLSCSARIQPCLVRVCRVATPQLKIEASQMSLSTSTSREMMHATSAPSALVDSSLSDTLQRAQPPAIDLSQCRPSAVPLSTLNALHERGRRGAELILRDARAVCMHASCRLRRTHVCRLALCLSMKMPSRGPQTLMRKPRQSLMKARRGWSWRTRRRRASCSGPSR